MHLQAPGSPSVAGSTKERSRHLLDKTRKLTLAADNTGVRWPHESCDNASGGWPFIERVTSRFPRMPGEVPESFKNSRCSYAWGLVPEANRATGRTRVITLTTHEEFFARTGLGSIVCFTEPVRPRRVISMSSF